MNSAACLLLITSTTTFSQALDKAGEWILASWTLAPLSHNNPLL